MIRIIAILATCGVLFLALSNAKNPASNPVTSDLYNDVKPVMSNQGASVPEEHLKTNGKGLIAALSSPLYTKNDNAHVYFFSIDPEGNYTYAGQTPNLRRATNQQGIASYKNELLILNHEKKNSIVVFDLQQALRGKFTARQIIQDLPKPTSVTVYKDEMYVTCYGLKYFIGQGIYIFHKDKNRRWELYKVYLYETLFNSERYVDWKDVGPIAIKIKNNIAYISNQYTSSVGMIDITKRGRDAYMGHISGPKNRLYYPLGIAYYKNHLYIAEHIHNYIVEMPLPLFPYDVPASSVLRVPHTQPYRRLYPYGLINVHDLLLVAIEPGDILVYNLKKQDQPPTSFKLPDGAVITAFTKLGANDE